MADIEIDCINRTDRCEAHERIHSVGGVNRDGNRWKLSQQDAINCTENGKWRFYINVAGRPVWVVVAVSPSGQKYLKTEADGEQPDHLLSLPEGP